MIILVQLMVEGPFHIGGSVAGQKTTLWLEDVRNRHKDATRL